MRKIQKKFNVGIAGYGVVGKKRAECIQNNLNLNLVSVCDIKYKNKEHELNGIKYLSNYKDLINQDIDIIFICLSNDLLSEVTIASINSGINIFCEKPPARNLEELKLVQKSIKNKNVKLKYGFNHRYHGSVQKAFDIIKSNEFGKIINMRGLYGKSKLITFNQTDWRTKRKISGGGVLLDQGIHLIDLMRLFSGEFKTVYSFVENSFWNFDVEDNVYAIMKTQSGIIGMINSSATQWRHKFNLDINLSKGSLILSGILSGSKSYGEETLTIIHNESSKSRNESHEKILKFDEDYSWQSEVDEFTNCVINNKDITNGSIDDAIKTLQLVYKIYYADEIWRKKYSIKKPN
tara:strand:+ start:500 stop:1546 length:1047 start_codon:yes stop_codon:yes gene_type:complete